MSWTRAEEKELLEGARWKGLGRKDGKDERSDSYSSGLAKFEADAAELIQIAKGKEPGNGSFVKALVDTIREKLVFEEENTKVEDSVEPSDSKSFPVTEAQSIKPHGYSNPKKVVRFYNSSDDDRRFLKSERLTRTDNALGLINDLSAEFRSNSSSVDGFDVLPILKDGCVVLKYGSFGMPHWRFLRLSDDNNSIVWFSSKTSLHNSIGNYPRNFEAVYHC